MRRHPQVTPASVSSAVQWKQLFRLLTGNKVSEQREAVPEAGSLLEVAGSYLLSPAANHSDEVIRLFSFATKFASTGSVAGYNVSRKFLKLGATLGGRLHSR